MHNPEHIVEQLAEIQSEMLNLITQAERLMRDASVPSHIRARAQAYWVPGIKQYLNTSLNGEPTMSSSIGELEDMGHYED